MQKYFRKTKEDHSRKSASGNNWWSRISLAVETLGLLKENLSTPWRGIPKASTLNKMYVILFFQYFLFKNTKDAFYLDILKIFGGDWFSHFRFLHLSRCLPLVPFLVLLVPRHALGTKHTVPGQSVLKTFIWVIWLMSYVLYNKIKVRVVLVRLIFISSGLIWEISPRLLGYRVGCLKVFCSSPSIPSDNMQKRAGWAITGHHLLTS